MEVPYLSKEQIANDATAFMDEMGLDNQDIIDPFDCLAFLEDRDEINYEYSSDNNYLGCIKFAEKKIYLSMELKYKYQQQEKHTILHEVAHWQLHRHLFHRPNQLSFVPQSEISCSYKDVNGKNNFDRKEWQANYFAGCVAMPEDSFKKKFWEYRQETFYPEFQQKLESDNEYLSIVYKLSGLFKCSKASVQIRLMQFQIGSIPLFNY